MISRVLPMRDASASARLLARCMVLAGAVFLLSGCIPYPVRKTVQPAASATVMLPDGQPAAGAIVTLISSAHPYGREKSRTEVVTGRTGVARFHSASDWRIEWMVMHGFEVYFWDWCVRHDGYATIETFRGVGFERNPRFTLTPGVSSECQGNGISPPSRRPTQ